MTSNCDSPHVPYVGQKRVLQRTTYAGKPSGVAEVTDSQGAPGPQGASHSEKVAGADSFGGEGGDQGAEACNREAGSRPIGPKAPGDPASEGLAPDAPAPDGLPAESDTATPAPQPGGDPFAFGIDTLSQQCGLTRREREVLIEIMHGYSMPNVAKKLYISPETVRTHMKNIYRKTETTNKQSLIRMIDSIGK